MTQEFGGKALVIPGGGLSTQDRIELGLMDPTDSRALTQRQIKEVTANRLRAAMSEVIGENVSKLNGWLEKVAEDSPKAAIELVIELAQFSLPKLKAVAVDVRSGDGSVKTLSVADLEAALQNGD